MILKTNFGVEFYLTFENRDTIESGKESICALGNWSRSAYGDNCGIFG